MKKIYLYVKESPRGLKYLGKTEQNPFEYLGSGTRWLHHIKKYKLSSKDIKTIILFETEDKELLKEQGLYYSDLYNIVDNNDWANLKKENGDGGGGPKSKDEKSRISKKMKGRKLNWSEEAIEKRNKNLKGRKMPKCKEETKIILSNKFKGVKRGNHTKNSYTKAIETRKNNGYIHSEETKNKIKSSLKGVKRPKEVVDKLGKKIMIDDIIYSSMSEAERVLNKSRYLINKHHKINLL